MGSFTSKQEEKGFRKSGFNEAVILSDGFIYINEEKDFTKSGLNEAVVLSDGFIYSKI